MDRHSVMLLGLSLPRLTALAKPLRLVLLPDWPEGRRSYPGGGHSAIGQGATGS